MPNRPGRNRVFNPVFNPPRLPDVREREFLPDKTCNVNSGLPTNNVTPLTSFHSGGGQQYYGLLQFDLSGYLDGFVDFTAAGVIFGGPGADVNMGTAHIGIMNPADSASWTNAATWNTKDGAAAWTGGPGGFLQPGSELTWSPAAMPGVVTPGKVIKVGEGSFPTRQDYHSRYDANFPAAAFANLLDTAISSATGASGKLNIYIYFTTDISWSCRPGSTTATIGERFRLAVWGANINPGLSWFGNDEDHWPPIDAYAGAAPNNAGMFGYPYFDMASVDPTNPTRNWHGGSNGASNFVYDCDTTAGGANDEMILMHFDISEFIGKTFSSCKLRMFGGSATGGGGTTTNIRVFVGQSAFTWAVGNGGGATSTSGPTWTLQEKTGSVTWPGGINVGSASFLDTVGQAETQSPQTPYTGGANTIYGIFHEIDITAMANRALSNYAGHLWLRVRATSDAIGASGAITGFAGPTAFCNNAAYNAAITQSVTITVAGYRTFPHLKIKTVDPLP